MQPLHSLHDPMLGRPRHSPVAVSSASESDHPAVLHLPPQCIGYRLRWPSRDTEAVIRQRVDELGYRRRSVIEQVGGEQVAQLGAFYL